MSKQSEVVARLLKEGATIIKDCKVVNCSITPMEEYVRINMGIDKEVKALVTEDGTTKETNVSAIFPSTFSVNGAMRENEDVSAIISHLRDNPTAYPILLIGAKVDVIQQRIKAGEDFVNPFSTAAEVAVKKYDEDKIISHAVNIRLSEKAKKRVEKIEDKLLGI